MTLPRRSLLAGLGFTIAAPAIVRTPGLLMPVQPAKLDRRLRFMGTNFVGPVAPASPQFGDAYFDTSTRQHRFYDGARWIAVGVG